MDLNFPNTFNPYTDCCNVYDRKDSPKLRAKILENMLVAAQSVSIEAIWVGRDLGHRGGRRTGLALTDDIHFSKHLRRWELREKRPTKGDPVAENTAKVVWEMLDQIKESVFLWNIFPLHPFPTGDPFANRSYNAEEGKIGQELLSHLCTILQPRRIVCLGNDAYRASNKSLTGYVIHKVRHPSFGGQNQFRQHVRYLYAI